MIKMTLNGHEVEVLSCEEIYTQNENEELGGLYRIVFEKNVVLSELGSVAYVNFDGAFSLYSHMVVEGENGEVCDKVKTRLAVEKYVGEELQVLVRIKFE